MFSLSQQISRIQSSPTLALNDTARQLREQGADIINLGIGEPLNNFPDSTYSYIKNKLESRQVKYSPTSGNKNLKTAIQKYTQEHYGRTPGLKNITVCIY